MNRDSLQHSLLVLFGLCLALALGEGFLRLYNSYSAQIEAVLDTTEFGVDNERNSLGLRDREYRFEHDNYRILALGDSFTYGWKLQNSSSWPKLLEQDLRSSGHSNLEVLNGGRQSTNTKWQEDYYTKIGHQYLPDMVLLGFLINDCTNTCSNCGAVRLKRNFDRLLKESSQGIHSEIWRVIRLTTLKRELEREILMEYMRPYLERTSDFQACTAAFRKLKKEVEKNGSKLVVFIYPMLYELNETFPFTPIHEQMLTFFDEEDISAFDITSSFYGERDTELWINAFDSHPNKKANTIAARAIASELSTFIEPTKQ